MNQVTALHRRAMSSVDDSTEAKRKGDFERAAALLRSAFELEAEAANTLRFLPTAEPSRSVLYRSAASLALQCGLHEEAEELIFRGLAGDAPKSISAELRSLLDEASFGRHLAVRGVELSNVDVQVVLEGNEVGPGIAPTDEVIPRVQGTSLLLFRTAERIANVNYRPAGPSRDEIRDIAESYMSLPRAASYAFTMKVGRLKQMSFVDPSENLLNEFLDCLDLVERGEEVQLKERIPDPAYYNNFVALAQTLLPDGNRVKTVGFSVQRDGKIRQIALRHTAAEIRKSFTPVLIAATKKQVKGKERQVEITGQLRLADSVHENNKIQVVQESGSPVTIYVPEGLMTDIVKPLWDDWVIVDGLKYGRTTTLISIRRK